MISDDAESGPEDAHQGVVLIVDDEPVNRQLLEGMLRGRRMRVVHAEDGDQAVALFDAHSPDLVLMDVLMPVLDGYEATRRIKAAQGDLFTPVLFVTALNDEQQLARCVECGGDDFVAKPVNRIQLNAKIDSWLRIKDLYRTVRSQRDALDAYQSRNEIDQRLARDIMGKVLRSDVLQGRDGLVCHYDPTDILSGDMILAATAPSGRVDILVGDFTGHGVAAAMGAVPISDQFHRMVADGRDQGDLIEALNERLYAYLPANLFLAAAMISVEPDGRGVRVWNGGMPDLLWLRDGAVVERFPSVHLPLGIEARVRPYDRMCCFCDLEPGDRLLAYSDGLTEARNAHGQAFGDERLVQALKASGGSVERVRDAVVAFLDGSRQSDDITLLSVEPYRLMGARRRARPASKRHQPWELSLRLDSTAMRRSSPIPALVNGLLEVEHLMPEDAQRVLTVLTELYTNALEHGVLGLSSGVKRDARGFDDYYVLRRERLAALRQGRLDLSLAMQVDGVGAAQLLIRVRDSGPGFDFHRIEPDLDQPAAATVFSGRGLRLVRALCSELRFNDRGNEVEAVYPLQSRYRPGRRAEDD